MPFIFEFYVNSDGSGNVRVDGGETINESITGIPTTALQFATEFGVGKWQNTNSFSLAGKLGEVIFYSGTLTTDERQDIEGILASKYSLQDNLAADHPHKVTPP